MCGTSTDFVLVCRQEESTFLFLMQGSLLFTSMIRTTSCKIGVKQPYAVICSYNYERVPPIGTFLWLLSVASACMDREQHRIHVQIKPPALEAGSFYRPWFTFSYRKLAGNSFLNCCMVGGT